MKEGRCNHCCYVRELQKYMFIELNLQKMTSGNWKIVFLVKRLNMVMELGLFLMPASSGHWRNWLLSHWFRLEAVAWDWPKEQQLILYKTTLISLLHCTFSLKKMTEKSLCAISTVITLSQIALIISKRQSPYFKRQPALTRPTWIKDISKPFEINWGYGCRRLFSCYSLHFCDPWATAADQCETHVVILNGSCCHMCLTVCSYRCEVNRQTEDSTGKVSSFKAAALH